MVTSIYTSKFIFQLWTTHGRCLFVQKMVINWPLMYHSLYGHMFVGMLVFQVRECVRFLVRCHPHTVQVRCRNSAKAGPKPGCKSEEGDSE